MNQQQITEQIYNRYLQALRRVSGDGTWMDEPAVRMALWLSLTEQADRLDSKPAPDIGELSELQRLHAWLDDNIDPSLGKPVNIVDRAMDAIRHLQDAWAAEAGANASLTSDLAAAKNEMTGLRGRCAALEDNQGNCASAVAAAQNEAAMLRQQRAELQEAPGRQGNRLANERALREKLIVANEELHTRLTAHKLDDEIATMQTIVTHKGANGNGAAPAPAVKRRSSKVDASNGNGNGPLTYDEARAGAFALIRQLHTTLGCPPTMQHFDQARPAGMASASGVAKRFGLNSWKNIIDEALSEQGAAVV